MDGNNNPGNVVDARPSTVTIAKNTPGSLEETGIRMKMALAVFVRGPRGPIVSWISH